MNDDESSTAGSSSDPSPSTSDATASAAGICEPQACHIDRDFAHGRTAPYGQESTSPADISAIPRELRIVSRPPRHREPPPCRPQPEHRLGARIRAVDDQPERHAHAVGRPVLAVPRQHLAVDRGAGERHPLAEEGRERRVGAVGGEGRVALTERPERAGQPVARARVRRVGQLDDHGARVELAVGLHPEHHVARVRAVGGLEVGERAQELVGGVDDSSRHPSAASGAGTRPPRERCRRRCTRPASSVR